MITTRFVAVRRADTTTLPNTEHDTEDVDETNIADEKLIQAVYAKPGLYNIKLPVKERTKLKKEAMWLEVTHVLGSELTLVNILGFAKYFCVQ